MIAFLRGNFVRKTPAMVHIEVNGIGYELHISLNTYSSISNQDHGLLHTYFHVREDAQLLYGFFEEAEKETKNPLGTYYYLSVVPQINKPNLFESFGETFWTCVDVFCLRKKIINNTMNFFDSYSHNYMNNESWGRGNIHQSFSNTMISAQIKILLILNI